MDSLTGRKRYQRENFPTPEPKRFRAGDADFIVKVINRGDIRKFRDIVKSGLYEDGLNTEQVLKAAIKKKNVAIWRLLLQQKLDDKLKTEYGYLIKDKNMLEIYLDNSPSPDYTESLTLLDNLMEDNIRDARYILYVDEYQNKDVNDLVGLNDLKELVSNGNVKSVKFLVDRGLDIFDLDQEEVLLEIDTKPEMRDYLIKLYGYDDEDIDLQRMMKDLEL